MISLLSNNQNIPNNCSICEKKINTHINMPLINLFDYILNNNNMAVRYYLAANRGGKKAQRLSIVYAAAMGNADMIKYMLYHGIPINTYDVLDIYQRTWESKKMKKKQQAIEHDMMQFTHGWSPVLTPACVAAFYGYKDVLKVLCDHDFQCMSFNPYLNSNSLFIGKGVPPSWNAVTCALFGQKWSITSALVVRGAVMTDMIYILKHYPLFLEFRNKIPKDVIDIIFSYLLVKVKS